MVGMRLPSILVPTQTLSREGSRPRGQRQEPRRLDAQTREQDVSRLRRVGGEARGITDENETISNRRGPWSGDRDRPTEGANLLTIWTPRGLAATFPPSRSVR